jgi:hypothetical protein
MMADSKNTVDQFIEQFKTYISFDPELFSSLQKFLGIQIEEDENYIDVHQTDYI